jgi:hypothetical protein
VIDGISISGGSQGHIKCLETERLDIDLDGGAGLTMKGVASSVALDASGGRVPNSGTCRRLRSRSTSWRLDCDGAGL